MMKPKISPGVKIFDNWNSAGEWN